MFFVVFFAFACAETDELKLIDANGTMTEAPAGYENCRWLISSDGLLLQPTYLPSQYRQEDLEVRFTNEDLGDTSGCQQADLPLRSIRIIQIRSF